jgi:hypothetical protein
MGYVVEQLVEALRYKPEGCEIDPRLCHWNFPLTLSFRPYYGPGVGTDSNKNECQEYFQADKGGRCLGLTKLSHSCAYYLEIWEPQPRGTLSACTGFALPLPLLMLYSHPDSKNCVIYIMTSQYYTEREGESVCVFVCVFVCVCMCV